MDLDGAIVPSGILASRTIRFKGKLLFKNHLQCQYSIDIVRYSISEKHQDYSGYRDDYLFGGFLNPAITDRIIPFDIIYNLPENNHYDYLQIKVDVNISTNEKLEYGNYIFFAPSLKISKEYVKD
jgi:hypothetical protein